MYTQRPILRYNGKEHNGKFIVDDDVYDEKLVKLKSYMYTHTQMAM
jgi:hypothetical protein